MADLCSSLAKILKDPEHLAAFMSGPTWPRHLSFCLTSRCQLNCAFCDLRGREPDSDLDWATFASAIHEFSGHGLRAVQFSGGEPLLWPKFDAGLALCVDLGLSVGVQTNGLAIADHAEALSLAKWVRVGAYTETQLAAVRLDVLPRCVHTQLTTVWHADSRGDFLARCKDFAERHGCAAVRVVSDVFAPYAPGIAHGVVVAEKLGPPVRFMPRRGCCPKGCYEAWWKVAVDWCGWLYPCGCIGVQTHDGRLPTWLRTVHISDAARFYAEPPRDLGHRCRWCPYAKRQEVLAAALENVTHPEFL